MPIPSQSMIGILLALVLAAGCSRNRFPTARVEGSVTLDGQPLEQGVISFVSQEPGGGPNASATITGGRYVAHGVPRGRVLASLHATKNTGRVVFVAGMSQSEIVNVIPENYRNGVGIGVSSPQVRQDFDLRSE